MRWLYIDENDKEENAARKAVLSRIERWWEAFAEAAPKLKEHFESDADFDVPAFMRQHLENIDQRIGWEFGPALHGEGDRLVITPEQFGLEPAPLDALRVGSAAESLEVIRGAFAGRPGPAADIIALNAGAALYVAERADTLESGVRQARELLASGAAAARLDQFVAVTRELAGS